MIRKLLTLALAAGLAGCAAGPQRAGNATQQPAAPAGQTAQAGTPSASRAACDAQPIQNMLGQAFSERVSESARQGSGSRSVRVLRPGEVMTMEYNATRLNIILDKSNAIEALRCG